MKNRRKIFEKNNNKNRVKKIKKNHSKFNSNFDLNKGITLVSLVVTIIILIILAGISMGLLLGENGILKKAKDSQIVQDSARILEKLELLKGPILIDENSVDLSTYKEKLEDVSEEYKVDYIEDIDANNAYVVVEGKYQYLLQDDPENRDVKIIYGGEVAELVLSETSGEFIYPEEKTFTVIKNESGGALSVSSSNENIATATIDTTTNIVTVKSGTTAGKAIITVTSAATDRYGINKATYEATVKNGTISISATAYIGNYDGAEHDALTNISTNPTGTTIKYKLKVGSTEIDCGTTMPKVTGANTYTVSITASKAGYETATKSITVTVGKQENTSGNLTLSATSGTLTYPTPGKFTVTKNTSGGALSVSSSNTNIATASINTTTKEVTVTPGTTAGTATITVTSAATTNYEAQTATYKATVNNGILDVSVPEVSKTHDGNYYGITVTVNNATGTTITYSTDGTTYSSTKPTYKDVGTYTTYYKVEKAGYEIATGNQKVTLSHNYSSSYTTDTAATCTTAGSKSKHCTVSGCTAKIESTTIAALGHNSVNGGTSAIHTKCSRCGVTLSTTHSYTKSTQIAATCTAKGTSKYTCSCGYYYTSQDIAATGHTYHITGYRYPDSSIWNETRVHASDCYFQKIVRYTSSISVRVYTSATAYTNTTIYLSHVVGFYCAPGCPVHMDWTSGWGYEECTRYTKLGYTCFACGSYYESICSSEQPRIYD